MPQATFVSVVVSEAEPCDLQDSAASLRLMKKRSELAFASRSQRLKTIGNSSTRVPIFQVLPEHAMVAGAGQSTRSGSIRDSVYEG